METRLGAILVGPRLPSRSWAVGHSVHWCLMAVSMWRSFGVTGESVKEKWCSLGRAGCLGRAGQLAVWAALACARCTVCLAGLDGDVDDSRETRATRARPTCSLVLRARRSYRCSAFCSGLSVPQHVSAGSASGVWFASCRLSPAEAAGPASQPAAAHANRYLI